MHAKPLECNVVINLNTVSQLIRLGQLIYLGTLLFAPDEIGPGDSSTSLLLQHFREKKPCITLINGNPENYMYIIYYMYTQNEAL